MESGNDGPDRGDRRRPADPVRGLGDHRAVTGEAENRSRPGRPRLLYRPHPEVAGSWGTPNGYAWLAGVLAGAVRGKQDARQAGRAEGRRRAAELGGQGDSADLMQQEMTQRGFRPARAGDRQRISLMLGHCPFAEVAATDPETVCGLHLGLAEGLADGLGGLAVERLTARDPDRAGCQLTLRRSPAGAGPGSRSR